MANWIARVLDRTLNDNYVQVRERIKRTMVLSSLPNKPSKEALLRCIPDEFDFGYIELHRNGLVVTPHGILACLYPEKGRDDLYFHQTVENDRPDNQRLLTTTNPLRQFRFTKQETTRPYHSYMTSLGVTLRDAFYFDDIDKDAPHHPYGVSCLRSNTKRLADIGQNRLLTLIAANNPDEVITLYTDNETKNAYGEEVGSLLDIATREGGVTGTMRCFGLNPMTLEFTKEWYELERTDTQPITMNVAYGMMLENNYTATFKTNERWPDDVPRPPYTDKAIKFFREELLKKMQEAGITNTSDRWRYFYSEEVGENGELKYHLIPDRIPMKTRAEWEAWENERDESKRPFVYVGLRIPDPRVRALGKKRKENALTYIHIPMFELKNDYANSTPGVKYFPFISASLTSLVPEQYSFKEQEDVISGNYRHHIGPKNLNTVFKGDTLPGDKYGLSAWLVHELNEASDPIVTFMRWLIVNATGIRGGLKTQRGNGLFWKKDTYRTFDMSKAEMIYCRTYDEFQSYFFDIADYPESIENPYGECFKINGSFEELKKQFEPHVDLPDRDSLYTFINTLMITNNTKVIYRGMSAVESDTPTAITYNGNTFTKNIRPRTEYGFTEVTCKDRREGVIVDEVAHEYEYLEYYFTLKLKNTPSKIPAYYDDPTAIHGIRQDTPWTKFPERQSFFFTGFTDDDDHIGYINNLITPKSRLRNPIVLDYILTTEIPFVTNILPVKLGGNNDYINDFYYIRISQRAFQECIRVFKENVAPGTVIAVYGKQQELTLPMYRTVAGPVPTNYDRNRPDLRYSVRSAWKVYQSMYEDDVIDPNVYHWLFSHMGLPHPRNDRLLHGYQSKVDYDTYDGSLPSEKLFTIPSDRTTWGIEMVKNGSSSSTSPDFDTVFLRKYHATMLKYGISVVTSNTTLQSKYNIRGTRYSQFTDVFLFVRMIERFITTFVDYDNPNKAYILDRYIDAGVITETDKQNALASKKAYDRLNIPEHMILFAKDYIHADERLEKSPEPAWKTTWLYLDTNAVRPHTVDEIFREMYDAYHYTMIGGSRTIEDTLGRFITFVDWLRVNRARLPVYSKSEYAIDWSQFKVKNPLFMSELESPNVNVVCRYKPKESVNRLMHDIKQDADAWVFHKMEYDLQTEDWVMKPEGTVSTYRRKLPKYLPTVKEGTSGYVYVYDADSVVHKHDSPTVELFKGNLELAKRSVLNGGLLFHAQYFYHRPAPVISNSNSEYYLFPYISDFFPINTPREVITEFFNSYVYIEEIEAFYRKYPPTEEGTDNLIAFLRGLKTKAYEHVMKDAPQDSIYYRRSPRQSRWGKGYQTFPSLKSDNRSLYPQLTFWYSGLDYVHMDLILNQMAGIANARYKPFIQRFAFDKMPLVFNRQFEDDPNYDHLSYHLCDDRALDYFWLAFHTVEHCCSPFTDGNLEPNQRNIAHRQITRPDNHILNIDYRTENRYAEDRYRLYRVLPRLFIDGLYKEGSTFGNDGRVFYSYHGRKKFFYFDETQWNGTPRALHLLGYRMTVGYDRSAGWPIGTTAARIQHYYPYQSETFKVGGSIGGDVPNDLGDMLGSTRLLGGLGARNDPETEAYFDITNNTRTIASLKKITYSADNGTQEEVITPNDYPVQPTGVDSSKYYFRIVGPTAPAVNEYFRTIDPSSALGYLNYNINTARGLTPELINALKWASDRFIEYCYMLNPNAISPYMTFSTYNYIYPRTDYVLEVSDANTYQYINRLLASGAYAIQYPDVLLGVLSRIPINAIEDIQVVMTAIHETSDLSKLSSIDRFMDEKDLKSAVGLGENETYHMKYTAEHVNRAIKYLRAHYRAGGENHINRSDPIVEIYRNNWVIRFDRIHFNKGNVSFIGKSSVSRDSDAAVDIFHDRVLSTTADESVISKVVSHTFNTGRLVRPLTIGTTSFGVIRARSALSSDSRMIIACDRPVRVVNADDRDRSSRLVNVITVGGTTNVDDSYLAIGTWLKRQDETITLERFVNEYVRNTAVSNVPNELFKENSSSIYIISAKDRYLTGYQNADIVGQDSGGVFAIRIRNIADGPTDIAESIIIQVANY